MEIRPGQFGVRTQDSTVDTHLNKLVFPNGSLRIAENDEVKVNLAYPAVDVREFGAIVDGVADDTAAIQAAINSIGDTTTLRPVEVLVPGPCLISDSLLIDSKSCWLHGNGWGNASVKQGSYLQWNGAAGIPMVKITRSYGAGVTDLRFIGKTSAKPSAAIQFFEDAVFVNIQSYVRNIWIGALDGYDTTGGTGVKASGQFTNGILLDGTNTNNSEGWFDFIHIRGVGTGINVANSQHADQLWSNLYIQECTTGFTTAAAAQAGLNWFFGSNDVDMKITQNGAQIHVGQYTSEGSGRMLELVNAAITSFLCTGGQFQAGANLNADGFFIEAGIAASSSSQVAITLDNFVLQPNSPPVTPKIRVRGNPVGGQVLILRNVRGIDATNLDVTPSVGDDPAVNRLVQIEGVSSDGLIPPLYGRNILTYPDTVDLTRWDTQKDLRVKGKVGVGKIPAATDAGVYIAGGGLKVAKVADPAAPGGQTVGTPGSTSYTYYVVYIDRSGNKTLASPAFTITTGNATLDGTNYNQIFFTPPAGCVAIDLLKTNTSTSLLLNQPTTPGTTANFNDQGGATAAYTPPTRNATGDLIVEGTMSAVTAKWARAYHNTTQALTTAVQTALAFNSERDDTDTIHDNATNNTRLTCKTAGIYSIKAQVEFESNSTGNRQVDIRLNGTTALLSQIFTAINGDVTRINVATAYRLAVNDYVECLALQNSGGNLNVQSTAQVSPEFSMELIGS